MAKEFLIYKKDGVIANQAQVEWTLNSLEDGRYRVAISAYKKRSLPQNKYYWAAMLPMVVEGLRHIGYSEVKTVDDAHEVVKVLFLKRKIYNENTGEEIEVPGSTAKLTTTEFNLLIDQVIQWAAEYLGLQIPLPNEPLIMFADRDGELNLTLVTPE